jgi:GrpB-like predicted nucleotidyltransferase (UPF0157 family)
MRLRPESEFRPAVAAAIQQHSAAIQALLPDAEIEHIGSTAVPGALTKGDLDLLVRVPSSRFAEAIDAVRRHYEIHQPQNWTTVFASFKSEPEGEIPIGIQLVVAGGLDDRLFVGWRERLSTDRALLESYNELKLTHECSDPEAYLEAKAKFIEAILGDGMGSEGQHADPPGV